MDTRGPMPYLRRREQWGLFPLRGTYKQFINSRSPLKYNFFLRPFTLWGCAHIMPIVRSLGHPPRGLIRWPVCLLLVTTDTLSQRIAGTMSI